MASYLVYLNFINLSVCKSYKLANVQTRSMTCTMTNSETFPCRISPLLHKSVICCNAKNSVIKMITSCHTCVLVLILSDWQPAALRLEQDYSHLTELITF